MDWAATALPDERAYNAAQSEALNNPGNPSSAHAAGKRARSRLEEARSSVGRMLGVRPESLVFTSGGTESNNIVISSFISRPAGGTVLVSAVEHSSVHEPALALRRHGYTVQEIRGQRDGSVLDSDVADAVDERTVLACFMAVNNETGALLDIERIVAVIRDRAARPVHIHVDAVQAIGKIAMSPGRMDIDSLSFSGHKIGAPRGSGFLYARKALPVLYAGGGQERGIRPGTENLAAAVGMETALRRRMDDLEPAAQRAADIKSRIARAVESIDGSVVVHGEQTCGTARTSPFILSASFPPIPGEVLVRVMNDRGFQISTGSACSSRKRGDIRVLTGFGYTDAEAFSTVRVSFGHTTSAAQADRFCEVLTREVSVLREVLP